MGKLPVNEPQILYFSRCRHAFSVAVPAWAVLFSVLLSSPYTGMAHRLDEYLQATLVIIEPQEIRLQMNLTAGVEVAEKVLDVIDRNHDGAVSTEEAAAYCALLQRQVQLRLDSSKIVLKTRECRFPEPDEIRRGMGVIEIEFAAPAPGLQSGKHRLRFTNNHLPKESVYLFNAALPRSHFVQITLQKRNSNQSRGELEFLVSKVPAQVDHPGKAP